VDYSNFSGKVALVTGASGGIGLHIAEKLAAGGATVVISSRSEENGQRALERLKAISKKTSFVIGDFNNYESTTEVVKQVAALNGGIDVLISAGAQGNVHLKPFAEMSGSDLVSAFESRLFPRIFPVHAALPFLRERGGSVVMLTTDAGRYPTPGESIVGAVGAGIILMTKALAKEFSRWSIRVNSVALTLTSDTPSWERIFGAGDTFDAKLFEKILTRFPSGRPPTAEEVSRVAVFLASEEALQVTGQTISVNGGLSFGGW
jgi:2-hydroxycyclohexanecarboxyl-CoA dehydrogenase